jgi:hypothetical protein
MGDEAQSYRVTAQVPTVHCDRVTHTQKCPPVTLAAAAAVEVTQGRNWYPVTNAV